MKKKCKHRGWWFKIKILWWKRDYLWCERCKNAIKHKEVIMNADILHSRSDGYFMSSLEEGENQF